MKRENRNYLLIYDDGWIFRYRKKEIWLSSGRRDVINIFRYGNDFLVVSREISLGYAGFELISRECELIQDCFFQNIQEVFEEVTGNKKDFFGFSDGYQADFLAQWVN